MHSVIKMDPLLQYSTFADSIYQLATFNQDSDCPTVAAKGKWRGVGGSVTVSGSELEDGLTYFVSGNPDSCLNGMSLTVEVVVGYDFKEERFVNLHRCAISFPDTRFFYSGTPSLQTSREAALKGEALVRTQFHDDPYGWVFRFSSS
ncbi:hypothetical protein ACH5RR_026543 [Cinchona calisaya]|uniref:Uncharacterized protein n=1 Tax=Cinchona calisaya TaxID=153742 RepID=A0ABD2Z319_9GENT